MGLSIHSANCNDTGWLPAEPEYIEEWSDTEIPCPHCANDDGDKVYLQELGGHYRCPQCEYEYWDIAEVVDEAVEILLQQENS